ncbi:MAG: hypothetical protein WC750_05095 [Patescibacteria group bacterium]|jgi:hypothetical protein
MSQAAVIADTTQMRMEIMYKGQKLKFKARLHPTTGDLDQLEEVTFYEQYKGEEVPHTIEAGARYYANRNLAARTDHATEYECNTRGLCDRYRGALHASQGYGNKRKNPGAEAQRLSRDEEAVRFDSFQLMTQGVTMFDPQFWTVQNIEPLIVEYRRMYDIRKVMARQDMERGMQLYDSLGRRNIPAACLAKGSAIGNIQLRRKAIRFLESHVSREAEEAACEIGQIRDAYRCLRYGFQPKKAVAWAYEDVGLSAPEGIPGPHVRGWLDMVRDRRDWPSLQRSQEWSLPFFKNIVVLPFRRNAAYVVRDISATLYALKLGDRGRLQKALLRLNVGIHWFFVLYHLEMQVITPLSILLVDLELLFKADRPKGRCAKFVPQTAMAPSEFKQILTQYYKFEGFAKQFRDGNLKHSKRDEILDIVDRIPQSIKLGDWRAFKEFVLSITDKL